MVGYITYIRADLPVCRKFDCCDVYLCRVWFGVLTTRSFNKGVLSLEYSGELME